MKLRFIATILIAALSLGINPVNSFAKKKKEKKVEQNETTNRLKITDAPRQLGGEWNIEVVNKKVVRTAERAYLYLHFTKKKNLMYAGTGCNTTNGIFTIKGNELRFKDLTSTELQCSGTAVEEEINDALRAVEAFYVTRVNNVDFLHLTNKHGNALLVLRRQNFDFLAGPWLVKTVNGSNISGKDVKLVIDMDQLTVNASSGCNIINGVVTIDHTKDFAVEFEDLKASLDNCPPTDVDMQMLIALEETMFCRKKNDNETELLDRDNNVVLVLKRISTKQLK